jgi:hypothetical protein
VKTEFANTGSAENNLRKTCSFCVKDQNKYGETQSSVLFTELFSRRE